MLQHDIYNCSGFYPGIVEDSSLLGYEAASMGNQLTTFPFPEYEDLRNVEKPGSV